MKTTVETITPKFAEETLRKFLVPDHQRRVSENLVDTYARIMRAGQWILTHQGIAIDDTNELIDGQHRLMAVVRSGVPVQMLVTRGIPHNGNKTGVLTIDAIDRGKERGVGQQLQLRHGVANGNLTAASLRGVMWLAAQSEKVMPGKFDVGSALRVMDYYGPEVSYCIENRSRDHGVRNATVIAASAFAMKACKDQVRDFYAKITTGENIQNGSPAMTARRWLMNGAPHAKASYLIEYRAILTCSMKHVLGESLHKLYDSEHGYNFFLEKQRVTVARLMKSCGFSG